MFIDLFTLLPKKGEHTAMTSEVGWFGYNSKSDCTDISLKRDKKVPSLYLQVLTCETLFF